MKKVINKFSHPIRGIFYAIRHDPAFKMQFYGCLIVGGLIAYFFYPLQSWEVLFVLLALALVLITELKNSALEKALDRMHPERHNMIGESKDMAAGAVLLSGFFLLAVIVVLLLGRI